MEQYMHSQFSLDFDFSDKYLDPNLFNFIPSIKYSNQINSLCSKLKEKTGIEYFSLCIEVGSQKFYLSNNPGNIAVPYYIRNLHKIDCSFSNVDKSKNSIFYPDDNFDRNDKFSSLFINLLKDEFHIYNHYGMVKHLEGYTIIVVLGGSNPVENKDLLFKSTQSITNDFTIDFIKALKWIFQEYASWLKYSRLFIEENFISRIMHSKNQQAHELSHGEICCLYWYKEGKTTKEIAQITKYSPLTVSSYFKSVKEKLNVKSTQQAMLIAIQRGLIA